MLRKCLFELKMRVQVAVVCAHVCDRGGHGVGTTTNKANINTNHSRPRCSLLPPALSTY